MTMSFTKTLEQLLAILRDGADATHEIDGADEERRSERTAKNHDTQEALGNAHKARGMASSPSLVQLLLIATLSISAGCGEVFDAADEHNELADSEAEDGEVMGDVDEDQRPGINTSTSGTGSDKPSASLSGTGTSTSDPEDITTDDHVDAPPEVFQPEVQGSHAPDPITAAGPVTLSVIAVDDEAIERVDFFVGDKLVAAVTDHDYGHYTHTLAIDHQDDAGEFEFQAVAVDNAGQTTTSGTVPWTVELPESGSSLFSAPDEPPPPGEHIYWEDVVVSPNGEFFVVGFRVVDGVTTLLSERRGPGGSLIDDSWTPPTKDRFGVAVAFMDSTPLVVARDVDGSSWVGRYTANGSLLYQYSVDDTEWRDVAVAGGLVYVVGNTGALSTTDTNARTWAMTPELEPYWIRNENAGGDKNVARAVAVADGRVFAVGQISYAGNPQPYGAAWAYAAEDGTPLWSREFPTENEDIFDVTVLPDGLRTAGLKENDGGKRMLVRHLQADTGIGVPINALEQTADVEIAYTIAASSHGEYVVAGAECALGAECFAQRRRYAGNSKKWQVQMGLKSSATRYVVAKTLPYGYVALLGQHDVNYGNGDQGSSWLRVIHP